MIFGMDTTTPEGREQFTKEYEWICTMAPEMFSKEDMVFPHEYKKYHHFLSEEPHFRRVWQHYRDHSFRVHFAQMVEQGVIKEADAAVFRNFFDLDVNGAAQLNTYIYTTLGLIEPCKDFDAVIRVMEALGLNEIDMNKLTAQDYEGQFWTQFDIIMELSEEGL